MPKHRTVEIEYVTPSTNAHWFDKRTVWEIDNARLLRKCWECTRWFVTKRRHTECCGDACRKERSRRIGGF